MQNIELFTDIAQILIFFIILTLLVKPLGSYMAKIYQGERTILSPVFSALENLIYRLAKTSKDDEMGWKRYALAMLLFNGIGILFLYALLSFQQHLPLNPQKFGPFSWHLAINTAVSFVTNTNWQAYSGESAASYFTQIIGLTVQNFVSAATGMAIVTAFIRGFARRTAETIGNFWVDLTRSVLYILLPVSIIAAIVLVSQGVIQNISPYKNVTPIDSVKYEKPKLDVNGKQLKDLNGNSINESITITKQTLPMGPVASQEAIKEFGTNGGGFFNANSSHPYENPTPFSNLFEILLILMIPAGLTYTFGRMVGSAKHGWALYITMLFILVSAIGVQYFAEYRGNSAVQKLGIHGYNMEGKEVRFGLAGTVLFSAATTATSCGAVNSMHDSLTPIGGMVPLLLILLSEVVFGGVGSGLYTMLAFVIIAVFTAGLMIGRTPEYLGKKIEAREMWMSAVTVLTAGIVILLFVAIALVTPQGLLSIANPGPHGLTEVLYAFASASNNNGSAFAGLNANTVFYNIMTAIAMILGRFAPAIAVLVMAGSLAKKKYVPSSVGTLPTDKTTFVIWLIFVILVLGALTFFPALSLGPIVEHLIMTGGF